MQELSRQQYLETMIEPMKRFNLRKEEDISTILKIAEDQLASKESKYTPLPLAYCYENGNGSFSHFLVRIDENEKFIVIISNDLISDWHGFYFLDLLEEYGINNSHIFID